MPPSAWSGAKSWCPPCRTVVEQQYPVVAGRRRAGRHEAPLAAIGEIADRLRLAGARRIPGGTNALALDRAEPDPERRSEEHTSELQSLMRISYAVFCLKKKPTKKTHIILTH